jgi:thioredoxin-dependent peroxiredoxin
VIGVSRDDAATLERFRASLELPFPMVADVDGSITKAYDAGIPLFGYPQRVTYVVSREGKIAKVYRNMLDAEAHVGEACAAVRAL